VLLLLAVQGCASGHASGADTPADAALAFHRLLLEGELSAAADYLADEDVALWAEGRRLDAYPALAVEEGGEPGALADSARLRSRRGDTAYVDVFLSAPDGSDPRWRNSIDRLYLAGAGRAEIMEEGRRLRNTVALERATSSVPVVLQDGSWRVSLGLRVRERFGRLDEAMSRWSEASSRPGNPRLKRLRAAAAYLALADSFPALADSAVRNGAAEMIQFSAYVDSVEVGELAVQPGGSAGSIVRGTARNRSAAELAWVTIHVMDQTGFTDEVVIASMPPHATVTIDLGCALQPGKPRAAAVSWVGRGP
jgi:hypothetical protein